MKTVRIASLIARSAFMLAMLLGLLLWIAQILDLYMLLRILLQIGMTYIHEILGITGTLAFIILAFVAVWKRELRLLGIFSMVYAILVVAFGVTQSRILVGNLHWLIQVAHLLIGIGAMYLARGVERRYRRLTQSGLGRQNSEASVLQVM
ncbi:hypothetical protein [Ktedonobacter racemifer]|uniref:Uncharacterized protein n=1 Tax=Ktedonobacter racemifer DSM 44963 TaxID=485913 RepID=D6THQ6_KTERA|nr:hypothetical protein [Ktedonobacter racemifer]EFH89061.1 hypothetical protein Krac_10584 [Ktedonobacter racemifer DSM 44963]